MCEDAGCDGHHEQVRPELLSALRDIHKRNAEARGVTEEEYQDGAYLTQPKKSFLSRLWSALF